MINSEKSNYTYFGATSCLVLCGLLEINQQVCHLPILKCWMLGEAWVEPWTSVHTEEYCGPLSKPAAPLTTYYVSHRFFICNHFSLRIFSHAPLNVYFTSVPTCRIDLTVCALFRAFAETFVRQFVRDSFWDNNCNLKRTQCRYNHGWRK